MSGVLAVALIVLAIVTITNFDTGGQWQTRAEEAETLAQKLEAQLKTSEKTTTDLQERTVKMADKIAQASDKKMVSGLDAKITAKVANELDTCSTDLNDLFDEIASIKTLEELQSLAISKADPIFNRCSQAAAQAQQLAAYLENPSGS